MFLRLPEGHWEYCSFTYSWTWVIQSGAFQIPTSSEVKKSIDIHCKTLSPYFEMEVIH